MKVQVWKPPDDFVFSGGGDADETEVSFDNLVKEAMQLSAGEKSI